MVKGVEKAQKSHEVEEIRQKVEALFVTPATTQPPSSSSYNSQENQSNAAPSSTPTHGSPSNNQPKSSTPISIKAKVFTCLKGVAWSIAFVATVTVSATLGLTLVLMAPLGSTQATDQQSPDQKTSDWGQLFPYQVSRPVNILVMGIDLVPDADETSPDIFAGRSDTMLLVHLNPEEQAVNLLSIPRDTQVEMPSLGVTKINHANLVGGPALSARVVSRTLNNVPIDRYVRVNTSAFRELVDLVGGVEVYVPEPMQYNDYTQKLKIDLAAGWQTLNGDQAEQFARYRADGYGDIGRVQRQQTLLKALRARLVSPAVVPKVPEIIRLMQKYVDTNLSMTEMLALAGFSLDIEPEAFRMVMLPGRFSSPNEFIGSYWLMNPIERDRVMEDYFNLLTEGSATVESEIGKPPERSPFALRIAIQNASGNSGYGREMATILRQKGFYNTYVVPDWTTTIPQTQIIVQRGDTEAAKTLQTLLANGELEPSSIGDLESDLTVRIGEDWLPRQN